MSSDAPRRAALCLLPVLLLAAASGAGRAAAPTKAETARKGFDYQRPNPGEILPNPPPGAEQGPKLLEFSPAASMEDLGGGASAGGEAPADAAASTGAGQGATEPAADGAPPAGPAGAGTAAPPSSEAQARAPTVPPPSAVQAAFAAEVARSGIGAALIYHASPGAQSDPAARAAEEQLWTRLDQSLSASRAAWDRRHPDRGGAATAVEAVVGPGHVTLLNAPGRVTGALDGPGP